MYLDGSPPITVQRFGNKIVRAVGVSFRRPQHKFSKLVERPLALFMGPGQAEKAIVAAQAVFWGLPASGGLSREAFQGQAAVPWNETVPPWRDWGLLKETPTALTILFPKR